MLRGVADGGHDGRGRGQHQRAGAEHHEDGHGPDDLAGDEPGQRRGGQGDDHDPRGPAVRKAHDLGLVRVRRLHKPDHPLDGAVLAHLGGLHLKRAKLVHRAAGHRVAHGLVHRQRFAGHDRLIDGGLAGDDHAVHGNALTGEDADAVPDLHLLGRNTLLPAVSQDPGRLGRQVDQLFDAGPGLGDGQLLQQRAQLHDERNLSGGERLSDADGRDQRQRNQHVRLDVERGDKADHGLQNDGDAAQDDGDPRRIERERVDLQQAAQDRGPGDRKERDIFFDAAQCQQLFQPFHKRVHKDLFYVPYGV